MKTVFSALSTKTLALLLLVLPAMPSCDKCKDDRTTLKDELVGEWQIESFTIDGVEAKGSVITSSKLEFEAYSSSNGDFEWFIHYFDGSSELQVGDYEVDETDQEITLEDNEGDRIKFDFDLEGIDLELSGILDGERYLLKAERD